MGRFPARFVVIAALAAAPLGAQQPDAPRGTASVSGQVVAADTRAPVQNSIVELLAVADSTQIGAGLTDAEGRFRLLRMPEGRFVVRLTSLGFGTVYTQQFDVAEAEARNLGELRMAVQAIALDPILVSAERTVVTYEADRTAYTVGAMPGIEGSSVTQLLATIPDLEVDIDGRVTLRNNAVAFYINGREAPMNGESLAAFLEQFPATLLAKVEVIDNPSSRYRAAGSGGVVNLVTKEGVELGISGSVFANAGTRGQYGVGGRANGQRGPWSVNTGGFLNLSDSENSGWDLRQNLRVDPAFLRQDTWSDRSGLSTGFDVQIEFEPSEASSISLEGRVARSGDESEGLTTTTHLDALEAPILVFDRARSSDGRDLSFDVSTGYSHEWEASEQELELSVELQRGTQRENSRDEITEETHATGVLIPAELTLENERELETQLSVETSYARNLGEDAQVELGWQMDWTDADTEVLVREIEDPIAIPDGVLTDRGHDQVERSQSFFTTLERSFGPLSVEGGLRAELAELSFALPTGEEFGADYTNFFPSANLSYRVGDDGQLRLSYSRRVQRPGLNVLNPVNRSTDPYNRRVGNPDIEPSFTHSVTMNASWSLASVGTVRVAPYWRTSRNEWAEITTVDGQGISTRTYQNVASSDSWGATLTYSLRERAAWRGNVSLSARRDTRDASNLDDRYSGSSTRFSTRANLNGRVFQGLSAEGNFSYDPPTDLPQGRVDARYRADLGLRYQMLANRASVRLSLRDPFALQRSGSQLRDLDYILLGRTQESTRSAQISVTYALGGNGRRGGFGGGGPGGGR